VLSGEPDIFRKFGYQVIRCRSLPSSFLISIALATTTSLPPVMNSMLVIVVWPPR
jgi:hypothetical protein